MWDMFFFFPNSQPTWDSHSANMISHEPKSLQAQIQPPMNKTNVFHSLSKLLFFVWLWCVCASPCCIASSVSDVLLVAFCSCPSPCCIACSTRFPLLFAVFSFARAPLTNAERFNRGYNPCLHMWCRCECSRSQPGRGWWWDSSWKRRNVNVLGCVSCVCVLCLVVERRGICDHCLCPLLY